MFSDSVQYIFAQIISCDSRQCVARRCSNFLWSSVCVWFNVLQLRLGYYSSCLIEVLDMFCFGWQSCITSDRHV